MKKIILLIITLIFLNYTYSFAADGVLQRGNSNPANLVIYHPKSWSNGGVWDLSDIDLEETSITKIKITFTSFTSLVSQEYNGLNLFIQDETGKIEKLKFKDKQTAITKDFKGQTPAQKWKLKYFVRELKHEGSYFALTPRLTIYYEDKH